MDRLQQVIIKKDLAEKYVFLSGPRQIGKTTLSKSIYPPEQLQYLNYDLDTDRQIMIKGQWSREPKLVILDEFHKFPGWKTFVKGYYDTEGICPPILVTGSAKLNVFRKGNDSMVGRYYYHRLLPLSVKELEKSLKPQEALNLLLKYSNFPEPFTKASVDATKRWRHMYLNKIIREDVTDFSNVRDLPKMQLLVDLLRGRVGSTVSYASLAGDLQIAPKTVKEWVDLLEQLFIIFRVTPYHRNIGRSLLKEPKIYFYDATMAFDEKSHLENLVAVSLLKHLWFLEDTKGILGELYYLRSKDGHEIDFATVEDKKITSIIEVKHSDSNLAPAFKYFGKFLPVACKKYQLVLDLPKPKNIDSVNISSMATFLSHLAL